RAAHIVVQFTRKTPRTRRTWPSSRLRRAFAAFCARLSTNTAKPSWPGAAGVGWHVSGRHLLEGVAAAGLEDPGDLLVELALVCDVHADVLHPDNIKRTIGK